jgi:hypothetical protein
MANKPIVWITSCVGSIVDPTDTNPNVNSRRSVKVKHGFYSAVETFDEVYSDYLTQKGMAIDYATWQQNPKRPPFVRYPEQQ